jgi:hypothetical protein
MFDALQYLGRYLLGQSVRLSRSDKFPTKSRQKTKVIAAITRTLAVSTRISGHQIPQNIGIHLILCGASRLGVGAIDPTGTG